METSGRKWKGNLLKEGRRWDRKNLNTYTRDKNSNDGKWKMRSKESERDAKMIFGDGY